jgi:hypothetical protein
MFFSTGGKKISTGGKNSFQNRSKKPFIDGDGRRWAEEFYFFTGAKKHSF